MSKPVLNPIGVFTNPNSVVNQINNNFDAIEEAFQNVVSRDGSVPNQMETELDMNTHRIVNVKDAVDNQDAVTKRQLDLASFGGTPTFSSWQISDSTTLGRALLTSPGVQEARGLLGVPDSTSFGRALLTAPGIQEALGLLGVRDRLNPLYSKVLYVQASITASTPPFLFKTITEACNYVTANIPLNAGGSGDFTRATIICQGLFNEQVVLPPDVTIRGAGFAQFDWEFTGTRTLGNFVVKPTFGNWIQDCRFWLSANETDETIFMDDTSRYFFLMNVHGVSRIPAGGSALSTGLGKSRFFTCTGAVWPKTILWWNVLIDADGNYTGNNAPCRMINTDPANGNHFADFRAWNLNIDALHSTSGCLFYIENLQDMWFMGPQFLGTIGQTDSLIRMRRTNSSGPVNDNMVHLIGGAGTFWTSGHDIGSGCAMSFEHDGFGIQAGPCILTGTGRMLGLYPQGGLILRRSPDILSVTNNAPMLSRTSGGGIRVKVLRPPGIQANRLFYALQPGYTGQFNVLFDIENKTGYDDDFYIYGLAFRNPTTRRIMLFGIRSGRELCLSEWEQPTFPGPVTLLNPNVRALRPYRDIPKLFGAFRDASGNITLELRDYGNTPVSVFHTLTSASGFTEIGIAVGDENAAGEGADIHLLINNLLGTI